MQINRSSETTLGIAALITGVSFLFMIVGAIYAEFYVRAKLIIPGDISTTAQNILEHEVLFRMAIYSYVIVFISDLLVAWGLYVFLKPVNKNLSLLTAWFRLLYTALATIALFNLMDTLRHLSEQLNAQAMLSLHAFNDGWAIALLFFAVHLLLLGYLVCKSGYIPKLIGIILMIAFLYYLIDNSVKILTPGFEKFDFIILQILGIPAWIGEIALAIWLLIKGVKVKTSDLDLHQQIVD